MPDLPAKPLFSIVEVADYIGVVPGTIRNWVKKGEFPEPLSLGKLVKWRREDIEEWLANRPQGFGSKSNGPV